MLRRKAREKIEQWIQTGKNALLVSGARQVGKTWLIRDCLKASGVSFFEVNLIEQPELVRVFDEAYTVDEMILNLSVATNFRFQKGETVLFIDEVQECGEIVTKIKFWVDEGSYRYILSGSLLGIALKDLRSAPVGYLDELQMFPLDLTEFLQASGVAEETFAYLREHYLSREPVSETVHAKLMEHFRRFLVVGGMPAAVAEYVETGDINQVAEIQRNIIAQYKRDFTKYEAKDKKLMLESVYDLIPAELLKQNRRFNYADIKKGLRFERVEDSFLWMESAGVALSVYNTTEPKIALKQNEKSSLLKLYLSDIGLLTCQYGNAVKLSLLLGDEGVNCGGIYENAVVMELRAHGYTPYYYNSKKLGELDFVVEHQGRILPIEVKSGKDYYVHSAIQNVLDTPDFGISEAIVFTSQNIVTAGKIFYLPVYLSTFLQEDVTLPVLAAVGEM